MKNFNHTAVDTVIQIITPYLTSNFCREDIFSLKEALLLNNFKETFTIDSGITKAVIISSLFKGVVIKLPFAGSYVDISYYDEKKEKQFSKEEWCPFICANEAHPSDYCYTETTEFNKFKQEGLNCFLAEIQLYKTVNDNFHIYIQEEVMPLDDEWFPSPSPNLCEIAKELVKENASTYELKALKNFSTAWLAKCINDYGIDTLRKFLTFCKDNRTTVLDDIHGGNYGYRCGDRNTPCLLDYCGYYDF